MLSARRCAPPRIATIAAAALTLGAISSCTPVLFAVANAPALHGGFLRHAGLVYAPGPQGKLDVYVPSSARGRAVVVFWYGGSWQKGHRASYRFVGAALAEAGFVAILPDYRLYPAVRFPDFNDDAARAVVWAHQHAAEFGGDPDKLFLMGHSAGAHIAASVALDGRYLRHAGGDAAWIRGLIGLSGPYILKPNTPALNTIFAAPYSTEDWQLQHFVSTESPPALLVHGGADGLVLPANSEALAQALQAHGVAADLKIVPGANHTDIVGAISVLARRRASTLDFVRMFVEARSAQLDAAARR